MYYKRSICTDQIPIVKAVTTFKYDESHLALKIFLSIVWLFQW